MSKLNPNRLVYQEYLRKGMKTPENRNNFNNKITKSFVKVNYDRSKRNIIGLNAHRKLSSCGSSVYSSPTNRCLSRNKRDFLKENYKNPCVKSYDLFIKKSTTSSHPEDSKSIADSAMEYMTEGKVKDLKATKRKIIKATGLKLRDYQRYRNGNKKIEFRHKSKNSDEVSNDRQDNKIKEINHMDINTQNSCQQDDLSTAYLPSSYKIIENKRRNLETPVKKSTNHINIDIFTSK